MNNREQLMRLADEYAHCYAFVGDDSMPIKRAEIEAYAESKQSELDKANARIAQLEEALLPLADCHLAPVGFKSNGVIAKFQQSHIINAKNALEASYCTWLSEHDKAVEVKVLEEVANLWDKHDFGHVDNFTTKLRIIIESYYRIKEINN